jgi:excisionase family DNA binding protein
MKTWLNVAEAAEYAGVSRDTIYTACERREIHYARVGGRGSIRLKPEWIDAWLERHARRAEAFGETLCDEEHRGERKESPWVSTSCVNTRAGSAIGAITPGGRDFATCA